MFNFTGLKIENQKEGKKSLFGVNPNGYQKVQKLYDFEIPKDKSFITVSQFYKYKKVKDTKTASPEFIEQFNLWDTLLNYTKQEIKKQDVKDWEDSKGGYITSIESIEENNIFYIYKICNESILCEIIKEDDTYTFKYYRNDEAFKVYDRIIKE